MVRELIRDKAEAPVQGSGSSAYVKCSSVMRGAGGRKIEPLCTDGATTVVKGWEGTDAGAGTCSPVVFVLSYF